MTTKDNIPEWLRVIVMDDKYDAGNGIANKRTAFARALYAHIKSVGMENDEMALDFVSSARNGHYWGTGTDSIPLGLKYIHMTQEEFIAIRALCLG